MDEPRREEIRAIWVALARRNNWMLVEDEAAFLAQVLVEFAAITSQGSMSYRIRCAVWRAYSMLLYRGLWRRQDQAGIELQLAFFRTAVRNGWPPTEAEEVAQEAIFRVISRLTTLQTPQGLLRWAFLILRTVEHDLRQQHARFQPLENDAGDLLHELIASDDVLGEIEQRLVSDEIDSLLRASVPIERQRIVLVRNIVLGHDLCDIASDLGIPPHRARQDKHRALERLKNDETTMARLRALANDSGKGQEG